MSYSNPDRAYVEAHRFMYGDLGEHVANAAILFRDRLMRPGFKLPTIRLAPVSPYGKCMALSGNGGSLSHIPQLDNGIWVYLHVTMHGASAECVESADKSVLHELLHNELYQFGENPAHKSADWARRCQEMSDLLGIAVRIERPRSIRIGKQVVTATPDGCLPYAKLAGWPRSVLDDDGPSLLTRTASLRKTML